MNTSRLTFLPTMPFKKLTFLFLFHVLFFFKSSAQSPLTIINQPSEFKASIKINPKLELIELKTIVPHIRYELKYATTDNFTAVRLYPTNTQSTFLRKEPAQALAQIAKVLEAKGLGILVWDAYRPYHVTVKFWELIKDERYVANPAKGSGHNRGIAIDMTLYDLKTGALLDMPTSFDDFSEKAHHGADNVSSRQKENREMMRNLMEKHGFIKFQTEWWHYYWSNGEQYDVLDFSFKQIKKINSDTSK
jgi:D-alanyl-D-alanine dipeptidase